MNLSNIYKYLVIGLIIGLVICVFGWKITSGKLETTTNELNYTKNLVESLKINNDRLQEYIKQKDIEIKNIEQKYKKYMNAIPADKCGDVKPSKELLEYFRKMAQNK